MTEQRKKEALRIVSNIRAGTTTNLSGGLFQGYQVLKNRTDPQDVSSILL
jgi:Mg-chelatase subunit ChlD